MAGAWSYYAGKLDGNGNATDIVELPDFRIGSINRTLSAPSTWTGSISTEVPQLKGNDGRPVFEPWNTVIMAEASGYLRGYGIYRKPTFRGSVWELDIIGLSGYPIDMPYDGEREFIGADPLDMYRHIWEHLQSFPYGNLGVTIDSTTSPIRVGTPVSTDASIDSGPRKLNWWDTRNLGGEIDGLSRETPFDWVERVYWDGNQPHCHIELGYPTIGDQKTLRFVLGENLATEPDASMADMINGTWLLGNGEGRARIRGMAGVADGRIRRIRVIEDQDERSKVAADRRASDGLAQTRGQIVVDSIDVYDSSNAPLSDIELGSEYPLYAETDHVKIDASVRVIGKSESPDTSDMATLTIIRPGVITL